MSPFPNRLAGDLMCENDRTISSCLRENFFSQLHFHLRLRNATWEGVLPMSVPIS